MSMLAPNMYITPASPVVVQQITRLNDKADTLLRQTEAAVVGLQSLSFNTVDLDPLNTFTDEELQSLLNQLGPVPGYEATNWLEGLDLSSGNENFVFSPLLMSRMQETLPDFIIPNVPGAPELPLAPSDPGDAPEIAAPDRPQLADYQAPTIGAESPLPVYTDVTSEVPFPILRTITLPTPPTLDLESITFDGVPPTFEGTIPDIANFQFTNEEYDPMLLDRTKQAIEDMMDGKSGLPAAVEDALFERAREREMETGDREVDRTNNEWAAKGHRYPAGPHARRVDAIRRETSSKISQLGREQFVAHWQIQIEQFRAALANAVALEESYMRLFTDAEGRRFQAARMQLDMALAIFNAHVSKLNADAGVFQVMAQVYRDRFSAEQIKIQVYAEQLRGQQIIGELNAQDVEIFGKRLEALQVNAEIYRTRVQAYAEQFRAVEARTNIYKAQLESNAALVDIYEADVRAFGEMVRAGQSRDERFNIKATIYGKNIDAWSAQYAGILQGHTAEVEKARLKRDVFVANGERFQAFIRAESERITALVSKYQAMAAEIGAKSEVERSRYALLLSIAQAQIERMRAAYEILLKNGEINITSGLAASGLQLRALETAATTLAQLAAGMTSAASVNAGISDSSSSSLSYNFSGEVEVN